VEAAANPGELRAMIAPPSGGRRSRDKGNRTERALVRTLQAAGFAAERVPLSGSAGGKFAGDVSVPLLGIDRTVEVKVRANGFRELYRWLAGADILVVKRDRAEPLVVLPLRLATEIATVAETNRASQPSLQGGRRAIPPQYRSK
jgi:Holliday junction resolvase